MSDEPAPTRTLPLWRSFLSEARDVGRVSYGAVFTVAELETSLSCKKETIEFQLAVSSIRKELRREGKNLTARGQGGVAFVITQPDANYLEMQHLQRVAITSLQEGLILGSTTPLELLDAEARARHEATLAKIAVRTALVCRQIPPQLKETVA